MVDGAVEGVVEGTSDRAVPSVVDGTPVLLAGAAVPGCAEDTAA
jgi:hypothetical protein